MSVCKQQKLNLLPNFQIFQIWDLSVTSLGFRAQWQMSPGHLSGWRISTQASAPGLLQHMISAADEDMIVNPYLVLIVRRSATD